MGNKTALYGRHVELGGKMVDFGGWDMPLHYGSQLKEHQMVRTDAGMFDVSHMNVVDITGADAQEYLRYLLANDVARIGPGKALYSTMLNEAGGILDDLIVYCTGEGRYRVVVNCATGESDLSWMRGVLAGSDWTGVDINHRADLGIIAVQGPNALVKVRSVVCDKAVEALDSMAIFGCAEVGTWTLARTGYTGEDGIEIILPAEKLEELWQRLLAIDIAPIGLGARDTLRLEAGLNLYGSDMDADTTPLEVNLAWTVAWEPAGRQFVGRKALEKQRAEGVKRRLVGVLMTEKGVLRAHQSLTLPGLECRGEITSGTFSPTLGCAVALASVPVGDGGDPEWAAVDIRGRQVPVRLVKPCFVRRGKPQITI
jgi:glycine cleavage system T protein (aminomethyltransferase)